MSTSIVLHVGEHEGEALSEGGAIHKNVAATLKAVEETKKNNFVLAGAGRPPLARILQMGRRHDQGRGRGDER